MTNHPTDQSEARAREVLANLYKAQGWDRPPAFLSHDTVIAAMLAFAARPTGEVEVERECQAVWRCAIGDATGALDVLKGRWQRSKRKAEREAGAVLAGVLDLVWAARDPSAKRYSEAAENGKKLIGLVLAALQEPTR